MKEIDEAFEAMFKELQKTGDPYDYPNATWSVVESCKQLVQSRIESLEKDAARWDMFVKISRNMMKPKEHREHSKECALYFDALASGHEPASAVDEAMKG